MVFVVFIYSSLNLNAKITQNFCFSKVAFAECSAHQHRIPFQFPAGQLGLVISRVLGLHQWQ